MIEFQQVSENLLAIDRSFEHEFIGAALILWPSGGTHPGRANGVILVITRRDDHQAAIEIHDSGPGLSPQARATLFEPTITFKSQGMGLGLSIAKKNALLSGGDLEPTSGALGGAAFRITLPVASE